MIDTASLVLTQTQTLILFNSFSLPFPALSPIRLSSTNQVPSIDLPSPLIYAQTEEERWGG